MISHLLQTSLFETLIHIESEELNYFHNPFSSDIEVLDCGDEEKQCWQTLDPSTSEKPLTLVIDLEATAPGVYTGRVKGFYLINETIRTLKTYEGDRGFNGKLEYYSFEPYDEEIIQEVASPVDETSFGYKEGYQSRLLARLCQGLD